MSMISRQVDELRAKARELREMSMHDAPTFMEQAADTIESLRGRLVDTGAGASERVYGTDGYGGHWLTGEEIVRCRDCKHYTDDEMEYYHYCAEWCERVEPDGFCKWGERRADA